MAKLMMTGDSSATFTVFAETEWGNFGFRNAEW
jgi:hypothetical protein